MSYKANALGLSAQPFTFATPSPLVLGTLPAGSVVVRVVVDIEVAFDDPAATLQVGTLAAPGLFLGTTDIVPQSANQYSTEMVTPTAAQVQLTIAPGASTQGSGTVYYETKP